MTSNDASLFILIGPTGAGKSSVLAEALKQRPDIKPTVSCTTRKIRPGEIDGVHYHFISRLRFISMIILQRFVEWARHPLGGVNPHFYGTLKSELRERTTHKLLEIELVGARNIKHLFPHASVIMITAPIETLRQRVVSRNDGMSEQELRDRVRRAEDEIREGTTLADHIIVNDGTLDQATEKLVAIFDEIAPRV